MKSWSHLPQNFPFLTSTAQSSYLLDHIWEYILLTRLPFMSFLTKLTLLALSLVTISDASLFKWRFQIELHLYSNRLCRNTVNDPFALEAGTCKSFD